MDLPAAHGSAIALAGDDGVGAVRDAAERVALARADVHRLGSGGSRCVVARDLDQCVVGCAADELQLPQPVQSAILAHDAGQGAEGGGGSFEQGIT